MAAREQQRSLGRAAAPLVFLLVAIACAAFAVPAQAATISVTTRADALVPDGACSLREAVLAANVDSPVFGCRAGTGNDVILVSGGAYELTIAPSGDAFDSLTGSLDVNDPQGQELAISSLFGSAVVNASAIADRAITARSKLVLNLLTVAGGDSTTSAEGLGLGGAIAGFGAAQKLTVRRSLILNNHASLAGGGIHTEGAVELIASTLTGNTVDSATGGGGGAIDVAGTAGITRSTISGNAVTSADDTAVGGGIRFSGGVGIVGSIVADNSADGGNPECAAAGSGAIFSGGFNVIETNSAGCALTVAGSDVVADPGLEPLAENGGPTRTHALTPGSPAINIGPAAGAGCMSTEFDQRGAPRGSAETGACDAGAYELAYCATSHANVIGSPAHDVLRSPKPEIYALALGGGDSVFGGAGSDALCGGPGVDVLTGGPGADLLIGGTEVDIANYSSSAQPVAISLDNQANDGVGGEGDMVQTESVVGGSADDVILGSNAPNGAHGGPGDDKIDGFGGNDSLIGQAGNDIVGGAAGNDQLRGGEGNDRVLGLEGNDQLNGDEGNDVLAGGVGTDRVFGDDGDDVLTGDDGNDHLDGDEGTNTLDGGEGNDLLVGGTGKDTFSCGPGKDTVLASRKDKVAGNCEKVRGKGKGGKGKGGKSGG